MSELPPCDPAVKTGTLVLVTHTIAAKDIEAWVKKVSIKSGQPVDWHYMGGRACVLATGDLDKVRNALIALKPEHDDMYVEASNKYYLEDPKIVRKRVPRIRI